MKLEDPFVLLKVKVPKREFGEPVKLPFILNLKDEEYVWNFITGPTVFKQITSLQYIKLLFKNMLSLPVMKPELLSKMTVSSCVGIHSLGDPPLLFDQCQSSIQSPSPFTQYNVREVLFVNCTFVLPPKFELWSSSPK